MIEKKLQLHESTFDKCGNPECVNGITECGEDDYGSYYSVKCPWGCFGGYHITTLYFDMKKNKNGTYSKVKK